MKSVIVLAGLFISLTTFGQNHRQDFQKVLSSVASQSAPLSCVVKYFDRPSENAMIDLNLKLNAQYPDSFFVEFKNLTNDHTFSSLVAYEGRNGHVLGNLTVNTIENETIYTHIFDGYLDDMLEVTLVNGSVTDVNYVKTNPQSIEIFKLECAL